MAELVALRPEIAGVLGVLRLHDRNARVDPQVIRLDQNRVDVVYQINDGSVTLISKIVFVGNQEFGEDRLSEVINSRESRWWRFLSTSDEYDPERLNFDKELLRRFYLKNGYIDFKVVDAKSELAPDRSGFFLTFTISEGERPLVRVDASVGENDLEF